MTNVYNTGNPLGSTDPRDLLDNASNLDDGMNSALPTFTDRLGVSRDTWSGMQNTFNLAQSGREAEFQQFLTDSGFVSLGNYAPGLNFTAYNQYMARDGFFYRPAPSSIPFTTTGTWVGGDADLFVLFSADDVLRQDLADATDPAKGAALVGYGAGTVADALQEALEGGATDIYRVLPNKTIRAPDGSRFVVRGVTMFDYLFASYEVRDNVMFRKIFEPSGKGPGTGISEPTYYARLSFISEANVEAQIRKAQATGVNLIRVAVEPAMANATVSYVDPTDGLTYPSDPEMLDTIIEVARRLGVVVQIQSARDDVGVTNNVTFMGWLTARYFDKKNVWINPANEINGTNADVNNATVWAAQMPQYVAALRADVAGQPTGTKFLGPIAIDPPGFATRIDLINTTLTTNPVFRDDPNLIINIHYYSQMGEADWRTTGLVTYQTQWVNFIPNYCIVIGEVGIDNFAGRYDPNLDPGIPSVNLTTWAQMQSSVTDFFRWCAERELFTNLNGVIGHMWFAYIPGLARHDDNSMYRQDGSITRFGEIFRDYSSAPALSILRARVALGARFPDGVWAAGDIADDSIINTKLGNMAAATIKGRSTAGSGDPEDLTRTQVLAIIAGLTAQVNNAAMGTPSFQAEGATGSRAAAAMIVNSASDVYVGFHNRATGLSTGTIIGNGTTGVNYATVSDYRLKTDVEPVDGVLASAELMRLKPVVAGWKFAPDAPRELMFLAHEVAEVIPCAVSGDRDQVNEEGQEVYQGVDYGKLTPLLVASLQDALRRIKELESLIVNP